MAEDLCGIAHSHLCKSWEMDMLVCELGGHSDCVLLINVIEIGDVAPKNIFSLCLKKYYLFIKFIHPSTHPCMLLLLTHI